jgi:hypothetical protein
VDVLGRLDRVPDGWFVRERRALAARVGEKVTNHIFCTRDPSAAPWPCRSGEDNEGGVDVLAERDSDSAVEWCNRRLDRLDATSRSGPAPRVASTQGPINQVRAAC